MTWLLATGERNEDFGEYIVFTSTTEIAPQRTLIFSFARNVNSDLIISSSFASLLGAIGFLKPLSVDFVATFWQSCAQKLGWTKGEDGGCRPRKNNMAFGLHTDI